VYESGSGLVPPLDALRAGQIIPETVVLNGQADLFHQPFKQFGGFQPHMVFQINLIEPGLTKISGKQNASGLLDDADHFLL
jgi:hypothetical protein